MAKPNEGAPPSAPAAPPPAAPLSPADAHVETSPSIDVLDPLALAPLGLTSHSQAHEYVTKKLGDGEEALFWLACLKPCSHWHLSVSGVGFSRFEVGDQKEEDEEQEQPVRFKGIITPLTGAKARAMLASLPKYWERWTNKGDPKKQAASLQFEGRRGYTRHAGDTPLALTIACSLLNFRFDRSKWPQPADSAVANLSFNRQKWPLPLLLPNETRPTFKLAL